MSITCTDLSQLLPELMDGQLPPADRDAAVEHLATCDRCTAVVSDMQNLGELYREHGRHQLSDEARARVLDALGEETPKEM